MATTALWDQFSHSAYYALFPRELASTRSDPLRDAMRAPANIIISTKKPQVVSQTLRGCYRPFKEKNKSSIIIHGNAANLHRVAANWRTTILEGHRHDAIGRAAHRAAFNGVTKKPQVVTQTLRGV
uniref:Uncharacterized protein n=1 Tax=Globodera pallida TaxID=36090 RepID=A0A183BWU7_GLOPA